MKALIVEDKEYIRKGLINILESIDYNINVIGESDSVAEAILNIHRLKPELLFLDINLPDGNGFDVLEQTKTLNYKTIFITAYEEFALSALKAGAVDYLMKPVDVEELKTALKKVEAISIVKQKENIDNLKNIWHEKNDKIILSLFDSFQVVYIKDLIYCETDKGYTTFYCINNKKYMVSKTLKEFEEKLTKSDFIRPHQSFMINMAYIDKYDKSGTIYLKNGSKIPVSTRKKESFLLKFLNWDKN